MFKILVTGSRNWEDTTENRMMFNDAMAAIISDPPISKDRVRIVVGDCPTGLDKIARDWCVQWGFPYDMHIARWDLYDKAAGPIRNQEMVDTRPDVCVGFPKPGEDNRGTYNCMIRAKLADIQVIDGTAIA